MGYNCGLIYDGTVMSPSSFGFAKYGALQKTSMSLAAHIKAQLYIHNDTGYN